MYNELVELDEERLNSLELMIRQKERITKSYNKKVKPKSFNIGDLVWKVILLMIKKVERMENELQTEKDHSKLLSVIQTTLIQSKRLGQSHEY